jgi:hypothetical protein
MEKTAGTNAEALANAILHTLAYADVFDYPLSAAEIHRYLAGVRCSPASVQQALGEAGTLSACGGFYSLPGRQELTATRRQREATATRLWAHASGYGRVIASLPFVRHVSVTGALALDNVEAGADIDYLIVTENGRLWLCRALVLLVGRLARLRHGVRLCPNYLVSLQSLAFPDRTLYAAHEIAQMVPLSGMEVYAEIRRQNAWVEGFLPNAGGAPGVPVRSTQPQPSGGSRPLIERLLRLPLFSRLEQWEMQRKIRRLSREQGGSPEAAFSADYCKGHDRQHQARAHAALAERLGRLEREAPA